MYKISLYILLKNIKMKLIYNTIFVKFRLFKKKDFIYLAYIYIKNSLYRLIYELYN
jgi:hypothetical protein